MLDDKTLVNARRWCARQFAKRRPDRMREHPSHLAAEIMLEAEKRYDLGTCGVEGWSCSMQSGVSYLNTGDSYCPTLVYTTNRRGYGRFRVASWADIASGRTYATGQATY